MLYGLLLGLPWVGNFTLVGKIGALLADTDNKNVAVLKYLIFGLGLVRRAMHEGITYTNTTTIAWKYKFSLNY